MPGESEKSNYLHPEQIAPLIPKIVGTIVKWRMASGCIRQDKPKHWNAIVKREYKV